MRKLTRWSQKYEVCVECGKNNSPYCTGGKCRRCYDSQPEQKTRRKDYHRRTALPSWDWRESEEYRLYIKQCTLAFPSSPDYQAWLDHRARVKAELKQISKEKHKEKMKIYYKTLSIPKRQLSTEELQARKEKRLAHRIAYQKQYRQDHREKLIAAQKLWWSIHKDEENAKHRLRNAKRKEAIANEKRNVKAVQVS